MLKVILTLIAAAVLFSGCHSHHRYAVVEPKIVIKPFKSYYSNHRHGYHKYRHHRHGHHKHRYYRKHHR